MIHLRPGVEMLCAVSALLAGILYWRARTETLRKIGAVASHRRCWLFLFTGVSRINIFEIMFHPMGPPQLRVRRRYKTGWREKW